MNEYKRVFVIVLDSLGIGAMPDSPKCGHIGAYFGKNGNVGHPEPKEPGSAESSYGGKYVRCGKSHWKVYAHGGGK